MLKNNKRALNCAFNAVENIKKRTKFNKQIYFKQYLDGVLFYTENGTETFISHVDLKYYAEFYHACLQGIYYDIIQRL